MRAALSVQPYTPPVGLDIWQAMACRESTDSSEQLHCRSTRSAQSGACKSTIAYGMRLLGGTTSESCRTMFSGF